MIGRRQRKRPGGRRPAQPAQPWFFCETAYAGPDSPWHLRPAGPKGRCPGGGADTPSACGREVAWDIDLGVTATTADQVGACLACREATAGLLPGH